ncbi:hypothetical protein GCM10028801_31240 [Nocardioides maradonensis]
MTSTVDLVEVFENNPEIDQQVQGMKDAVAFLEKHAHLPTPAFGIYTSGAEIFWYFWASESAVLQRASIIRRAIGGKWEKLYRGDTFELNQQITEHLQVRIITQRDQVCERRQIGTETVVVPAVEAQPERTEERPVYEYECSDSLLAKE